MLTIHELLKDPAYRAYFLRVPALPAHYTEEKKPWKLYVQLKADPRVWRSKRFGTYAAAFAYFKKNREKIYDAAINCPAMQHQPPNKIVKVKGKLFKGKPVTRMIVWKPKMPIDEFEDHFWCGFCRRPTVFRRVTTHHALPLSKLGGLPIDPELMRCVICGASENIVKIGRSI